MSSTKRRPTRFSSKWPHRALGNSDKASLVFDLNESRLKLPEALPSGAMLKIPQQNAPALAAFALMAVFLVLVGRGWLLRSPRPPA